MMATTAWTVTARKAFRCYAYPCEHVIQPGEEYARHVAFPWDNDIGNQGFWVMRVCRDCETKYRSMPPRKRGGR